MRLIIDRLLFASLLWLLTTLSLAAAPDPLTFELAVERGNIAKVRAWLDEGLDPNYEAAHIGTGLMVAAWYGHVEMMQLFVERGADLQRSNRYGEQPLQLAAWNGHLNAVDWLLARGAPLDRAGNAWSALHYAVFNGRENVAQELIARGANVNARAPNLATPLMMAAREGHENLAKSLLEAGADRSAQSDWGDSALTMAMRYQHLRLAKMIASPEEFAIAVKAPPATYAVQPKSLAPTAEIEALLAEIRATEAEGRPSEALHRKLQAAMAALRDDRHSLRTVKTRSAPPRALVITARRAQPGAERVQIVSGREPTAKTSAVAGRASRGEGQRQPPARERPVSDQAEKTRAGG